MEPLEGDGVKRLYYPGVFDGAVRVQEYYGKRARYQHAADEGQLEVTARIRRFNNCVKTMMIESFMDGMKGNLRILDLACGRGQDILKYSREHRLCTVQHVMGIDFAAEAVEEAKRTLCSKAQASGRPEFLADFRCGDLRKASTLEDVVREGRSFDVVLCQLALHYLLSSEEAEWLAIEYGCFPASCHAVPATFGETPSSWWKIHCHGTFLRGFSGLLREGFLCGQQDN
eukprot:symbB.v1.2.029685.t3/scaffold3282.1/size59815/1